VRREEKKKMEQCGHRCRSSSFYTGGERPAQNNAVRVKVDSIIRVTSIPGFAFPPNARSVNREVEPCGKGLVEI
jgi:hypothetical protein